MNPWLSYFLGVVTPFALFALYLIGGLLIDAFTPTKNYSYSRCVFCHWDSIRPEGAKASPFGQWCRRMVHLHLNPRHRRWRLTPSSLAYLAHSFESSLTATRQKYVAFASH